MERLGTVLAASLLGALCLLRPAAQGVSPVGTALFWLFVLAVVVLPGVILCRAWDPTRRSPALVAGQGATLGLALHGLASLAGLAVGKPWIGEAVPTIVALAALAWSRRTRAAAADEAAPSEAPGRLRLALLALLALTVVAQPLISVHDLERPVPVDLLFHAGNAAEVRHRWPLQDPRAAGLPLNYPLLSYALPAAASRWLGLPVADALLALAPLLWIGLFVLQVYNAGRVLFEDARVGLIGAALASFHPDAGRLLGLPPGAFNSHFATGLYGSPTTVVGFLFLTGIAVLLGPLLSSRTPAKPSSWAALALLGMAAAATKASVLPTVLGGLFLLAGWARLRRGDGARRALLAALVLVAVAAPPTLALSSGEQTYRELLRWGPGAVVWESDFARRAEAALFAGSAPAAGVALLARAAIAAGWALGYFGLAGVGALAYLLLRPPALTPARLWAAGVLLSGALLTFSMQALGLSQLFFLYNGQVLLPLFGAAGLRRAVERGPSARTLLLLLALFSLPTADHAVRALAGSVRKDVGAFRRQPPALVRDYAQGLAWLRAHAAQGVVVFADNPSFLLSAFGECRNFYESGSFTPRGHQQRVRGNPEPYPERVDLQDRLLRRPDPAVVREVLAHLPPGAGVRLVADAVQPRLNAGMLEASIGAVPARRLFPPTLFDLEYASRTLHVYRLRAPGEPAAASP